MRPIFMARTKRPNEAASPGDLRKALAALDRELVDAIGRRAELLVAALQKSPHDAEAVLQSGQAAEARPTLAGASPVSPVAISAVFRELNSDVRSRIRPGRVAYLGPEYSYSHLAAIARFGQSGELVPVGTIAAVFQEVEEGQSDYGLVPLENSTDGRVSDTLDNFARRPAQSRVQICGEVPLSIHHYLLGRGPRADIREVQSKPQALSQCRNWLAMHLPAARIEEVTSTAAAAKAAREQPGVAAIASRQAGINYELDVLATNIEDNPGNVTRFAVLGQNPERRTGDDKTSLMFELAHKPGALADAITVLKRHRINLTWLESFPMTSLGKNSPEGGYYFFVEFVGHQADAKVRRALASLGKRAKRLEVLGSYARGAPVE